MPNVLWAHFAGDRQLLIDVAALAASVIRRWVYASYGVVPLIMVIPHTFGRRLNFHPHLHILVSAGGLDKRKNRWINFQYFDKYVLMYWWRFAISRYLAAVVGANDKESGELNETFNRQSKRPWNIHIKRFSSKSHFLRYAGRYLRRPPIANHRIISVTDDHVEYWANDLQAESLGKNYGLCRGVSRVVNSAHPGPLCERHSLLWTVVTSSEASALHQCVCAPGSGTKIPA
jgi:hypothetical protein